MKHFENLKAPEQQKLLKQCMIRIMNFGKEKNIDYNLFANAITNLAMDVISDLNVENRNGEALETFSKTVIELDKIKMQNERIRENGAI